MLSDLPDRSWRRDRLTPQRIAAYIAGCVLFSLVVKMFIDPALGTDPLHALLALAFGEPVGFGAVCFVVMVGTLIPPMRGLSTRYLGLINHGLPDLRTARASAS